MTADNLADHMEAVPDTEWGIQDRLAAVVHSQVVEDSQNSPDNHLLPAVAGNSCKDCNLLAMVEQSDMAWCSVQLDMVLLALHHTHTHKYTHVLSHIHTRQLHGDGDDGITAVTVVVPR